MARTLPAVQEIVRGAARRLTGADGATFVLRDDDMCVYADEDAIEPLWKGQRFPMSACVSGWSMIHATPVVIPDIYVDDRIPHDAYRPTFVKSLVMVPIRRAAPIGAIGAYWAQHHEATDEQVVVLQALADSTSIAIDRIQVVDELADARQETLIFLARATEQRDDMTFHHTERVGRLAARLAEVLGQPDEEVEILRLAAPLHDIGKLSLSDDILLKPGRLTPGELARMQEHTVAGARMLDGSRSAVLRAAQEIALSHHERWDGNGYPHRLREDDIPLRGRIVAVADVFDALTHRRPYKPAWPLDDAIAEIRRQRAVQFDPAVVEAFLGLDRDAFDTDG